MKTTTATLKTGCLFILKRSRAAIAQVWNNRSARLVVFASLVLYFSIHGCTRSTEYQEEVVLGNPPRIEVIKRREVQELLLDQLRWKWIHRRSEIFLFGKYFPVWSESLWPIYLEKLPDGASYLLVAGITSSADCVRRGRPSSYYVSFLITRDKTTEITTPARLEGKERNLIHVGSALSKKEKLFLADKRKYEPLGGMGERQQKLLLSSPFGC